MKKVLAIFGAALFALLPLSACGKTDDGLTTLKINEVTHSVFYAPMYLADSLGYFKEEGIKIDLSNGGGADSVMAAVLSGDAIEKLKNSAIDELVMLDTIYLPAEKRLDKMKILSTADIWAAAIENVYLDKPMSKIYD